MVLIVNRHISIQCANTLRNKFDILQEASEINTPNDEYINFLIAHIEEASDFIPTKPIATYSVPWELIAVKEKRDAMNKLNKIHRYRCIYFYIFVFLFLFIYLFIHFACICVCTWSVLLN